MKLEAAEAQAREAALREVLQGLLHSVRSQPIRAVLVQSDRRTTAASCVRCVRARSAREAALWQ
eukprot:7379161-Prymnesium_polylepis.1